MTTERVVRIFAGSFILASLALGIEESPLFVSRGFLALTAFVGANLLQSGFTRFCPLELALRKAGVRSGVAEAARRDPPPPHPRAAAERGLERVTGR
jgi:hypothetical protein